MVCMRLLNAVASSVSFRKWTLISAMFCSRSALRFAVGRMMLHLFAVVPVRHLRSGDPDFGIDKSAINLVSHVKLVLAVCGAFLLLS